MATATPTNPSTDSGIEVTTPKMDTPSSKGPTISSHDEKQVAVPRNDTDKQFHDPHAGTDKQVISQGTADTDKIFVPTLGQGSDEKQVTAPTNNTDKEIQSPSSSPSSPLAPSASSSTRPASGMFRVEKSNPMGLVLPQDQRLMVRALDPATKLDRGPALVTSDMDWVDVMAGNPPPFELYTAHDFARPELVARFTPRGWQGIVGMSAEFEASCQGERQKWEVVRRGLSRTYHLNGLLNDQGCSFVWKGSTKAVRAAVGDQSDKRNKGNLKLTTTGDGADGEVLAVWVQWRDSHVLGDVIVFEAARDKLALEVILTSCICVVSAERANGLNWFGGLGK